MLYCPMCGTAFQRGSAVCRNCSAPLPTAAPDLGAMDRAEVERSSGFTLAWSRFLSGFVIATQRPAILFLPLLFAVLSVCAQQLSYLLLIQRVGGIGGGGGLNFWGNGVIMTWLMSQLNPAQFLNNSLSGLSRLGLPVPTPPVYGFLSLQRFIPANGMPTSHLFDWLIIWLSGLVGALGNAFQWRIMAAATRQERTRLADGLRRIWAVKDVVLLLSLVPTLWVAATLMWRIPTPRTPLVVVAWAIPTLFLGTWGAAKVMADSSSNSAWVLWRHTLFSAEGYIYLFLSAVLLTVCQYGLGFWQVMMGPSMGSGDIGVSLVTGIAVYVLFHWVLTCVTQGLFCLMETLAQKPDTAAALAAADQDEGGF
jgi:hypothetical protein